MNLICNLLFAILTIIMWDLILFFTSLFCRIFCHEDELFGCLLCDIWLGIVVHNLFSYLIAKGIWKINNKIRGNRT